MAFSLSIFLSIYLFFFHSFFLWWLLILWLSVSVFFDGEICFLFFFLILIYSFRGFFPFNSFCMPFFDCDIFFNILSLYMKNKFSELEPVDKNRYNRLLKVIRTESWNRIIIYLVSILFVCLFVCFLLSFCTNLFHCSIYFIFFKSSLSRSYSSYLPVFSYLILLFPFLNLFFFSLLFLSIPFPKHLF